MLVLGAIMLLVFGLVRVLHDLLERGPYEPPVVADESDWSRRSNARANSIPDVADGPSGAERMAMTTPGEHEGTLT
jgi:hypothetical protein